MKSIRDNQVGMRPINSTSNNITGAVQESYKMNLRIMLISLLYMSSMF